MWIFVLDIIFTSGGTEANNLVLNTAVEHFRMTQNADNFAEHSLPHIITSSLEHDSIKLVLERYRNTGRAGTFCCTDVFKKVKVKVWIAVNGNTSHGYGVSLAIWDRTVLPATRHKWTHPALTPAIQAGTRFIYPGGMEGWVDLSGWLRTETVYLSGDSHSLNPSRIE